MRFRHHKRPERSSIREANDSAMGPVEAEVFRSKLPSEGSFPSGVSVGDPTEPPAQVENVTATAGLRTLLVEWGRLEGFQTVDGAGGYEVEIDIVSTFDDSPRTQRTSATMASFTDLSPNTTYFARVRGVQGADNAGEWSDWASVTTAQADTADIQAGAVTADKIAANAVNASKLAAITMEVGKYIQSDNYDGTDVETADATQGFRIEAEGRAEFRDVRVRGDVEATRFRAVPGVDNLLPPGTFEASSESWTPVVGSITRTTAQAHTGSYSLQLSGTSGTHARSGAFEVTPGDWLRVSFWAKQGSGTSQAAHQIRWESDYAGTLLSVSEQVQVSIEASWTQAGETRAFEVPAGAVVGRLEVLSFAGAVMDFFIDDVAIVAAPFLSGAFTSSEAGNSVQIVEDHRVRFVRPGVTSYPGLLADGGGTIGPNVRLESGAIAGYTAGYIQVGSNPVGDGGIITLGAGHITTPMGILPAGRLAYGEVTSNTTFDGTAWVTVASTDTFYAPVGATRRIAVVGQSILMNSTAPQLLYMRLQQSTNGGAWTTVQEGTVTNPSTSSEVLCHLEGHHTLAGGDNCAWRMQVLRGGASGTGTARATSTAPAWVKAVDEGAIP